MLNRRRSLKHRTALSASVVALQSLVTIFFLYDLTMDVQAENVSVHFLFECIAVLGLIAGVAIGAVQIRWLVERARQDETAVAAVRGAMSDLIAIRFAEWGLTDAESDVALFALHGFDVTEIAEFRKSASGTVRVQLTKIYGKAGVKSHVEFMALFMDDMIGSFAK